jgi:hypothetical protein
MQPVLRKIGRNTETMCPHEHIRPKTYGVPLVRNWDHLFTRVTN